MTLLLRRHPRIRIQNLQREHDGRVRVNGLRIRTDSGHLANLHVVADSFKPATPRHAQVVKKAPIVQCYVRHEARRAVELAIGLSVGVREVRPPVSSGHDGSTSFDAVNLTGLRVSDRECFRLCRISIMLYPDSGRSQADARRRAEAIKRGKVDVVSTDLFQPLRSGDRIWN